MSEPDKILAVTGLEVRYGAALALLDVNLDVPQGSVMAVLGTNGAGKSTLARACSGLVPSVAGKIEFDGQDVTTWSADRRRRAGLIYLPEGRGIFPNLSVLENMRVAVRLTRDKSASLDKAFSLFPVLAERKSQRAGSLSGGEQQMLSLARALAVDPKLVVVDEPSLGLAPKMVDLVFGTLEKAKAAGMTLIIIEQFAHKALALADHCVILRRGRVTWNGSAAEAATQLSKYYFGAEDDNDQPISEAFSVSKG